MTDTDAPTLTLWISRYGGWDYTRERGSMTKVVFCGPDADEIAVDYMARKRQTDLAAILTFGLVIEPDEETDWDAFPKVLAFLNPSCEHGMSADLCAGPGHYPADF